MIITIDKETDRFFIGIGKEGNHSFVMFGIYTDTHFKHLLCKVGKVIPNHAQLNCLQSMGTMFGMLFSQVDAQLQNEKLNRDHRGDHPITYQAYDASYEQYLEFIAMLEALQTNENKFRFYKPVEESDKAIILKRTSKIRMPQSKGVSHLRTGLFQLSVSNTCRTTAIKLVEEIQQAQISASVSSVYFINLPCKTRLVHGQPSTELPFYVLPVTPALLRDLSAEKMAVAQKLYHRMEQLVLLEPELVQTVNKFNRLKELYLQVIGPQKELSLNELLDNIHAWKEMNRELLGCLRKTYFWDSWFSRESATMKLVNEIEADLELALRQ